MDNAIELRNVNKSLGNFSLDNISLSVKKGFVTGLIGENGAGKSTLIKIVMNLIRPDSGDVKVLGMDYQENEKAIKDKVGFIYNNAALYDELTLSDIRKLVGHSYKKWDDQLFLDYCAKFELPLKKVLEKFSEGMKMKASLAMALSHDADLLILDEPTSNLDPIFRREFIELLREVMLDEGKTIFISTHILSDLSSLADYITFMDKGEIIFSKDVHSLTEQHAIVRGGLELLDADIEKHFTSIKKSHSGFEALTEDVDTVREMFKEQAVVEKASLEDIMYFKREARRGDTSIKEKYQYS